VFPFIGACLLFERKALTQSRRFDVICGIIPMDIDLMKWISNVRPSTKRFFDFSEI